MVWAPGVEAGYSEIGVSLAVALLVGVIIGFEREQAAHAEKSSEEPSFIGGARTHSLAACTAALAAVLGRAFGPAVLLLAFAALVALLVISYVDVVRRGGDRGVTSELAFLITFSLGALAASPSVVGSLRERALLVIGAAVVLATILSLKPRVHAMAERSTRTDVVSALKFLLVAVVVLPLLPREAVDPWGALVPFKVGLLVTLIATVDFVGYVAIRVAGVSRGLGLTGVLGGLASSTAVALAMAGRAKREPERGQACAVAVVAASTIVALRVGVEVGIVYAAMIPALAPALAAIVVFGGVAAYLMHRRSEPAAASDDVQLQNPFELSSALKWGAVLAAVLFAARLATMHLGERGAYLTALVAGAADADAVALSMAELAGEQIIAEPVAVSATVIGICANTVLKGGIAAVVGGLRFARHVAVGLGAIVVGGLVGIAAVQLLG